MDNPFKLIQPFLTKLNQDSHVPVACFVFVVSTAVHWLHHLDSNYVAIVVATYAFLGGHAVGQMKWGDKDGDKDNVPTG